MSDAGSNAEDKMDVNVEGAEVDVEAAAAPAAGGAMSVEDALQEVLKVSVCGDGVAGVVFGLEVGRWSCMVGVGKGVGRR